LRARIHGLWVFAKISGLVLGVQMMTGMDISDTGMLTNLLEGLAISFEELDPIVVITTTVGIPIANLVTVIHHVRTAYDHRGRGVGVSCGGFFGMFSITIGALGGAFGLAIIGVLIMIGTLIGANYKFDD